MHAHEVFRFPFFRHCSTVLAKAMAHHEPLTLFQQEGPNRYMDTTEDGMQIPKMRHVSGPCWEAELGEIKEFLTELHIKSQKHGWRLVYWSHEAMDTTMNSCSVMILRDAYFKINAEYRAARADLFRLYVLFLHGGVWLDLRGTPRDDPENIGLETIPRFFQNKPPPLLFQNGGQHKHLFNNECGEIMNGFIMSIPSHPIFPTVCLLMIKMIDDYPRRWQIGVSMRQLLSSGGTSAGVRDHSKKHYTEDCDMFGREGVLCLGALAMSKGIHNFFTDNSALAKSVPKNFENFWNFYIKNYRNRQGRLFLS